jgi:hypothetical protein
MGLGVVDDGHLFTHGAKQNRNRERSLPDDSSKLR